MMNVFSYTMLIMQLVSGVNIKLTTLSLSLCHLSLNKRTCHGKYLSEKITYLQQTINTVATWFLNVSDNS